MYFCAVLCSFCVVLCIFVLFYVLFVLWRSLYCLCVYMCTELLPPGGYPTAVKYIIYHIKSSIKFHPCCCLPVLSCVSRSMLNSLFLCIKSSFTHRTHSPSSITFSTLNFFFDLTECLTFVHFSPRRKIIYLIVWWTSLFHTDRCSCPVLSTIPIIFKSLSS